MNCDYTGCWAEATTKGHIYGHVRESGESDCFLPVYACDEHRKKDEFFEGIDIDLSRKAVDPTEDAQRTE